MACTSNIEYTGRLLLTGVDVVSWLKVEHGTEPGMVQVRTRGAALGEDGYREAREQHSRRYA